jgi:hypothetical protein
MATRSKLHTPGPVRTQFQWELERHLPGDVKIAFDPNLVAKWQAEGATRVPVLPNPPLYRAQDEAELARFTGVVL